MNPMPWCHYFVSISFFRHNLRIRFKDSLLQTQMQKISRGHNMRAWEQLCLHIVPEYDVPDIVNVHEYVCAGNNETSAVAPPAEGIHGPLVNKKLSKSTELCIVTQAENRLRAKISECRIEKNHIFCVIAFLRDNQIVE